VRTLTKSAPRPRAAAHATAVAAAMGGTAVPPATAVEGARGNTAVPVDGAQARCRR